LTVVTLSSAGANTWTVPADCPAGTVVTTEAWGAGAGASGRVGTTFGSGGGGGAYAKGPYTVTSTDVSNGISYIVGAGSAGVSGANPVKGGYSIFGCNSINNSTNVGAVVSGALPTGWAVTGAVGLTTTVAALGTDGTTGLSYIDITISGTPSSTANYKMGLQANAIASMVPVTLAAWNLSGYFAVSAGALTNVGSPFLAVDGISIANVYVSTPIIVDLSTITGTLTRKSGTASFGTTVELGYCYFGFSATSGSAVNCTFRIAGLQFSLGSSLLAYMPTPGCVLASGGFPPQALVGGLAGPTASSIGSTAKFAGGAGAAYNASGSGGGGSGGKDGAGVAGNTTGVGGQGDATTGGLGGAVKTTSPGNPGTANAEGGGGGGGLTTVAGTGGAGGAPGGGGGGAAVATGTGGTGGAGQIRLTYTPVVTVHPYRRWNRTYIRRLYQLPSFAERIRRNVLLLIGALAA
jgi:hypothetical protein